MGGVFKPQVVSDPRNKATSAFSQMLSRQLAGAGGTLGERFAGVGTLPGFQGPFAAGITPGQQGNLDAVQQAFAQFMGGSQGQDVLSQLRGAAGAGGGLNLPPEIAALLGGGGGQSILQGLGGGTDPVSQMLMNLRGGGAQGQNMLASLFGGQNNPALQALMGFNTSTPERQLLQNLGSGTDPVSQRLMGLSGGGVQGQNMLASLFGGQNDSALQALMGFNANTPERQLLLSAGNQNVTGGGQGMIAQAGQMFGQGGNALSNLLSGGQGTDINQIAQMLDTARQPGLNRDLANLREQFSFSGLRNSTDLEGGAARLMGDSQAALTGQLAAIMPLLAAQSSQNRLGGLGALTSQVGTMGNLGQMAGQLGLGQQQNVLGAFGQAGQLGQGGQGQMLQALSQAGQLGLTGRGQNIDIGNLMSQFGLSSQGQQINSLQALLQNQLGAFGQAGQLGQGSQGQMLQALSQAGQLESAGRGQNIDIGNLMGQLGLSGQGQQANSLQALLQNQLGAGQALQQGGTQQADILSRLFSGQQGNALQALLAMPGATSMFAQLPGILGQQAFSMEDIIRQSRQQGIQNQIGAFNQSQSLIPQLLGFLSNTPQQQVGPSVGSQIGQLGIGAAGVAAAK